MTTIYLLPQQQQELKRKHKHVITTSIIEINLHPESGLISRHNRLFLILENRLLIILQHIIINLLKKLSYNLTTIHTNGKQRDIEQPYSFLNYMTVHQTVSWAHHMTSKGKHQRHLHLFANNPKEISINISAKTSQM